MTKKEMERWIGYGPEELKEIIKECEAVNDTVEIHLRKRLRRN